MINFLQKTISNYNYFIFTFILYELYLKIKVISTMNIPIYYSEKNYSLLIFNYDNYFIIKFTLKN